MKAFSGRTNRFRAHRPHQQSPPTGDGWGRMIHRGIRRHPCVISGELGGKASWGRGGLCLRRNSTARAMTTQGAWRSSCQMGVRPWRGDGSTKRAPDSQIRTQTMRMTRCTAVSDQWPGHRIEDPSHQKLVATPWSRMGAQHTGDRMLPKTSLRCWC